MGGDEKLPLEIGMQSRDFIMILLKGRVDMRFKHPYACIHSKQAVGPCVLGSNSVQFESRGAETYLKLSQNNLG